MCRRLTVSEATTDPSRECVQPDASFPQLHFPFQLARDAITTFHLRNLRDCGAIPQARIQVSTVYY